MSDSTLEYKAHRSCDGNLAFLGQRRSTDASENENAAAEMIACSGSLPYQYDC